MTVQPWLLTGPRGKSDARATASTHADSPDGSDATAIVRSQRCRLFDNPSLRTIRVRVRENNVRKWTGGVAGAKPRTAIRLMPKAESPVRPSNAPCPNVSREPQSDQNACHVPRVAPGRPAGQGSARRMAATVSGLTHPTCRRTARVVRPGADVARRRAAAAHLDVANEGECVRLLPGLRLRAPTAVHHRGLDGSTMETTTPP
jgi:hypothetical protein